MEVRSVTSVNGSRSLAAEEMAQQDSREGCLDPARPPLSINYSPLLTGFNRRNMLLSAYYWCALDMRDTPHL